MQQVFIGLGSNLDNPEQQLQQAVAALANLESTRVLNVSSFYKSVPMGPQDQDDYINAVAVLETGLEAESLLDKLQEIEHQQGRVRLKHWGPRTLDLDILVFGNRMINSERLTVPHPGMTERNFVLFPLAELVHESFDIPGKGKLSQYLDTCSRQGIEKITLSD